MQRHWRTVAPPVNVALAAFVGFQPKTPAQAAAEDFDLDGFLKVATMFKG